MKEKGISPRQLRKLFRKVLFPWNKSYSSYRFLFRQQLLELPLFVVVFTHRKETVTLLDYIAAKRLQVRVINGRHSSAIQNPDLYADISRLHSISLIKIPGLSIPLLRVGGGTSQGQVYKFLFDHRLPFAGGKGFHGSIAQRVHPRAIELGIPGGSSSSVGFPSFCSAGGFGVVRRTVGLAVDRVVQFTIAIPPTRRRGAKIVVASCKSHSDLFWALRGGLASNFGIVLEVVLVPFVIHHVVMYSISYQGCSTRTIRTVLRKWQETAPRRPKWYNEDLFLSTVYKGECEIGIGGVYVVPHGQSKQAALSTVEKEVSDLGGKLELNWTTYPKAMEELAAERFYRPFSAGNVVFRPDPIDPDLVISGLEKASKVPGIHLFLLELMGGEISRVSRRETAFWARNAQFSCEFFTYWDSTLDTCANTRLASEVVSNLYDARRDTIYVGLPINGLPHRLKAYYGGNRHRLKRIKAKIDPLSVLHFPTGIVQ